MLVTRVIGTKIRRRPNTSATRPSTRGWLVSERIATTRSRTLPTWSPWGSKIGRPTSRAAYTRPGLPDPVCALLTVPSGELAVRPLTSRSLHRCRPPRALASLTSGHATVAPARFAVTTRAERSPFRLGWRRGAVRDDPPRPPAEGSALHGQAPRRACAAATAGAGLPRGLGWGLGALLLVGVLTVVAVVRGSRRDGPADLSVGHLRRGPARGTSTPRPAHPARGPREARREAAATATRGPDAVARRPSARRPRRTA